MSPRRQGPDPFFARNHTEFTSDAHLDKTAIRAIVDRPFNGKGKLLINGHNDDYPWFIRKYKDFFVNEGNVQTEELRKNKVGIINAGFNKGEEKDIGHIVGAIRDVYREAKVPVSVVHFDLVEMMKDFLASRPHHALAAHYHQTQSAIKKLKERYYQENLRHFGNVEALQVLDREVLERSKKLMDDFYEHYLHHDTEYENVVRDLNQKLMWCRSILICSGHFHRQYSRLKFFRVFTALRYALQMGTNLIGVSAGTMMLNAMLVFELEAQDLRTPGHFFTVPVLFEEGAGILSKICTIPHHIDYLSDPYDPHLLRMYAMRQPERRFVGLTKDSTILAETYFDPERNREYELFSSIGNDPIDLIDHTGHYHRVHKGDRNSILVGNHLPIRGTRFHEILSEAERENPEWQWVWDVEPGAVDRPGEGKGATSPRRALRLV